MLSSSSTRRDPTLGQAASPPDPADSVLDSEAVSFDAMFSEMQRLCEGEEQSSSSSEVSAPRPQHAEADDLCVSAPKRQRLEEEEVSAACPLVLQLSSAEAASAAVEATFVLPEDEDELVTLHAAPSLDSCGSNSNSLEEASPPAQQGRRTARSKGIRKKIIKSPQL